MANQDSEILPLNKQETPCEFNELVSTNQPSPLTDTLSVFLESCEPFSTTAPETAPDHPSQNLDEPNTDALVDPFNSIALTESSEVKDPEGQNSKFPSTRRSTRKIPPIQKTDIKLAARKPRKASGKKPMLDLLSANVGRRKRSNFVPRARPSSWGLGGKIDEIFKKNVNENEYIHSRKAKTNRKGGKRNNTKNTKKGLLFKFKLGTKPIETCQFNTIPDIEKDLESDNEVKIETSTLQSDIKDTALTENLDKRTGDMAGIGDSVERGCLDPGTSPDSEVINMIPESQQVNGIHDIPVVKDCNSSHQSSECGVGSGIPSPEIVNDVLSIDKFDQGEKFDHGEKQVEESGSPQTAWVCCDDCHKWRRIPSILADSIESTECRWICKDNMDKAFGDCSIPQEKSNADINEELELSEASCEEDNCDNNNNTRLNSSQKQMIDLSWKPIKTNMFLHRNRKNQTIDEIMVCHCKPPLNGGMGCLDECLNRMLNIECVKGTCPCGDFCSNQQFQKRKYSKLKCFPCGKKGFGLQLQEDIPKGRFLIEYVGEVLDMPAYDARQREYAKKGHKHFYFMTLNGSEVIDACAKGNLGRFINHSCQPNCQTEKWMVNGEVCIGLFACRDIKKGEELTFDYNYVRVFGAAAKKCVCGSARCRGVIGGDSLTSETLVLSDSDDEFPEEQPPVTLSHNTTNNNNKPENNNNLISITQTAESTSKTATSTTTTTTHFEDVENENEPSPDSLLLPIHDKIEDHVMISVELAEREVSIERSSSESKVESEGVKKVKSEVKKKKERGGNNKSGNKCVIIKPQPRSKVQSTVVKRGKGKVNNNKAVEIESKPVVVPPQKPKRIGVDTLTGRFEAVQEALNTLLNSDGGISKRRDAWKGYLKLLCLTAHSGNGEGIQSNRDLSMILDALLKTKSRTVLFDIINKNGLQMLHNLMKHYRKEFIKIPILRKLLKVLEFLAETKILTLENILKPSLHGAESFKESILSLTEHKDKQVHQIARNFRDRWIPWHARKIIRADRDIERTFHSFDRDRKLPDPSENSTKMSPRIEASAASCLTTSTRTRKRKSRWDEAGDITLIESQHLGQTNTEEKDESAPPGFSSPVKGHLQDRYNSRLPTAYGIPSSVFRQLAVAGEVAPAMTFHPFPPLPTNQYNDFSPFKNPNTLGRRYYKQHKWNSPRSGPTWNSPNKYGPGQSQGGYNNNNSGGGGFYGR